MSQTNTFSDPFKNVNSENMMNENGQFNQITENPFGNIPFSNQEQNDQIEMPTAPQTNMIQTQGNVQLPIMGSEMGDPFANINFSQSGNQSSQMQMPQQMVPPQQMQMPQQMVSPQQMQMPQQMVPPQQNHQSFNQFGQQQYQQNNFRTNSDHYNNNNQQRKYNIIDIAWFINHKLYDNSLVEPECAYAVVSYNADFNNLRIGLKGLNSNVPFNSNYLTPNNWFNRTSINLYPENCAQIKYSGEGQFQIIERMFNLNANWIPNTTIIAVNQNSLIINSVDSNNNQHSFTFIGYQYELLNKCFDFMLSGEAWSLHCRIK